MCWLFTKCSLKTNQTIFVGGPLLVFLPSLPSKIDHILFQEMIIKWFQLSLEEVLQLALTKMPNEDVNVFMSLSNSLLDCVPCEDEYDQSW